MRAAPSAFAIALVLASAQASADDVVVTREGERHRGTIVENVPGERVVIAVEGGELVRVDGDVVRYAGPSERAPGDDLAPGASVRVRFEAEPGWVFYRVLGTSVATAWDHVGSDALRLCRAPCALTLPAGSYHLALGRGGWRLPIDETVDLMRSGELTATHVDRSALRVAGWLTIGLGAAAAISMMTIPWALDSGGENDDSFVDWLMAGSGVLFTTQVVGIILAVQPDSVAIRFD